MNTLLYKLFYGLSFIVTLIPFSVLYIISDLLYFIIFYVVRYRKKITYENIKNSFPDKSPTELMHITKQYYKHFCDMLIESYKHMQISQKDIVRRWKIKNIDVLNNLYDKNKSVIAMMGHYGNWEWSSGTPLVCKHKVVALYKPLSNKYVDKLILDIRQRFGVQCIPMNEAYKQIVKYQKNNIPIIILMLGDQSPIKQNIQYWTTFLNQPTAVLTGTEKIARKLDFAVVFFKVTKIKRGYYETEVIPLFDNAIQTTENEITEKHVRQLEQIIYEKPEYWLWSHRRWKHKPDSNK